jgi:glycolate oxidase FAD binding subunit
MSAIDDIRERVREASAQGRALRIRGAGSKDFYGQALEGEVLDTRAHRGIVSFEPTELVVTARCGTPLAELEAELAGQRQMLAFEPPAFGDAATVGGMVAVGLSGPRRAAAGAVRDYVLGVTMVDASGEINRFGGQVMKNVAGYDVSRLLCGSMGVLGLIAEVSLKVLPVPPAQTSLAITMSEADALRHLNEWAGQPLPISASAWHGSTLQLRFSGATAAVEAARARFVQSYGAVGIEPEAADAYWAGVREQANDFFAGDEPLWRLSLPSVAPAVVVPGRQLIEWGGALRWLKTDASAAEVRAAAHGVGGNATLFRGGDKSAGVFEPLASPMAALHRRLKREFDPRGVFNPHRMYPEF